MLGAAGAQGPRRGVQESPERSLESPGAHSDQDPAPMEWKVEAQEVPEVAPQGVHGSACSDEESDEGDANGWALVFRLALAIQPDLCNLRIGCAAEKNEN